MIIKNARIKLELAIPTGAPITAANDAIDILPLITDKPVKVFSK